MRVLDALTRRPLRWIATALHRLVRGYRRMQRAPVLGIHAVAIAPGGEVVLVKLRYARGWRLPGGGRSASEDPREAVLRELREEIGLEAHGAIEMVVERIDDEEADEDLTPLFIVRDVEYRPRWSLEVEAVTQAPPDRLPPDMSPLHLRWLQLVRPIL
jgi:8-oxo-dGTP pyrophosphatase MutT (NUDIX family)